MAQVKGNNGTSGINPVEAYGVWGDSQAGGFGVIGTSTGVSSSFPGGGVKGQSESGPGLMGISTSSQGVSGSSTSSIGVSGVSATDRGVKGESQQQDGVWGISHSDAHSGVWGQNTGRGVGVGGISPSGVGVMGQSTSNWGVGGTSESGAGVSASSQRGTGLRASGSPAGQFDGDVTVNGNATVTGTITADVDIFIAHADCAEDFDIAGVEQTEPGTVMVIEQDGVLRRSERAYDKRVAGVISGAGDYKPGIVLDKQQSSGNRMPVALVGKVYCKVDAQYASIEVGDLLTSSATPGHAMKADDPVKSFGSVIGKALRPLADGRGLIPILIALQ